MQTEAPMRRRRIAVLGDAAIAGDMLIDGGAIAVELARPGGAEVTFRSVATSIRARERLDRAFREVGIDAVLTSRNVPGDGDDATRSDLRLGDPIDIAGVFGHDVVVLAARDVPLRRFLADLPVHTRPDVRILAVLHFTAGVPEGERVEDVLRFDAIAGAVDDFAAWGAATGPVLARDNGLAAITALHERMVGSNLRAIVAWRPSGETIVAEPHAPIVTIPPGTAGTNINASWAGFVATVALGMASREPFVDAARRATTAPDPILLL